MASSSRMLAVALTTGAVAVALAGCSGTTGDSLSSVASRASSIVSQVTTPGSSPGSTAEVWTADKLTEAFAQINKRIGAEPADYIEVTVGPTQVAVKAINPQNRQNVDEYDFVSGGVKVDPVDVSHNEPGVVEQSVFASDTVKPAVLAQVMAAAPKDSGVDDVTVSTVVIKKFFADDDVPFLQVNVSGPRASKSVQYDLSSGELQRVL